MSIEWYAVHTYVGHEEKVRENVMSRARSLGIADNIYQVVVPTEETVEHAGGGKKEVIKRKLFPGYIFVQMNMGDNPDEPNEAWETVRYTPWCNRVCGYGDSGSSADDGRGSADARQPRHHRQLRKAQGQDYL